jgi:hypothetical protein
MQSCFGASLFESWHSVGARHVVGFESFNRNFFYFDFFFRNYVKNNLSKIEKTFQTTNRNIIRNVNHSFLYHKIVKMLKPFMGDEDIYTAPYLSSLGQIIKPVEATLE